MNEILKIKDLWGGYTEGVDILRGISMEVQQGEAVGIIGLNGSGKSTFGKAIMNMIPIRRGEILFDGEDITALSTSQLSHHGISIMQQGGRVFPNLSVWDNLQLASNSLRSISQKSKIKDIIPLLQLPKRELQHLMADKLSGGQKHQLSLAMSLFTNPRLVIFDEPSAGLSPKAVEDFFTLFRIIRDNYGITSILIEQNISKALENCNKVYIIKRGTTIQTNHNSIQEIEILMFNSNSKDL